MEKTLSSPVYMEVRKIIFFEKRIKSRETFNQPNHKDKIYELSWSNMNYHSVQIIEIRFLLDVQKVKNVTYYR